MYIAFYLQPSKPKHKRIVICKPFVGKPTIAWAVLRSVRRKDTTGGIMAGDEEDLKKLIHAIDGVDSKFSSKPYRVMAQVGEMAVKFGCKVFFKQEDGEPTFASDSIGPQMDQLLGAMTSAGVVGHVDHGSTSSEAREGDEVSFKTTRAVVVASSWEGLRGFIRGWSQDSHVKSFINQDMVQVIRLYANLDGSSYIDFIPLFGDRSGRYRDGIDRYRVESVVKVKDVGDKPLNNECPSTGDSDSQVEAGIFDPKNMAKGALKKISIEGTSYITQKGMLTLEDLFPILFHSSEKYYAALLIPANGDAGTVFGCRTQCNDVKAALKLYETHLKRLEGEDEVDLPAEADVKFFKFARY